MTTLPSTLPTPQEIADRPGFGTGRAYRDTLAQVAGVLADLPLPGDLPVLLACGIADEAGGEILCLLEDDDPRATPWVVCAEPGLTDTERDFSILGTDASARARAVRAVLEAYRTGLIARVP